MRISRPASRLLAFLELLQLRPVVDGAAAAAELGVSERTIRRYAVALSDLGIPVDGQPGVGGGYRLRPGTRLPPLMLSNDEATAVVVGLAIAEHRGLSGAGGALAKIVRVLPDGLNRRVGQLREELSISGESSGAAPETETLLLVAEAVRRRRSLEIHYARRDGSQSDRTIEPLGIVARRGRWYVPARDRASGELRTFRADRIGFATIGAPASPRDPEFDPAAHVVEMLAQLPWPWEIDVRVHAPADELAPRISPAIAQLTQTPAGTMLSMRAESLEWAAGVLAGLGADFDIVRPDELREHVRTLAGRLAAAGGPAA